MASTDDDALAARLREFQSRCGWPGRWRAARYVVKLLTYHVLTQPALHRYTRPLYEALGQRNPLPGPTTPEERSGERPQDYEQRLSNAQALLALRQLCRLDANLDHRRRIGRAYARRLEPLGGGPPAAQDGDEPALVRYPMRVPDREAAVRAISPYAVPGLWFTSVLEEAENPGVCGYAAGTCPNAEVASRHLVNLPTHPRVNEADAEAIAVAAGAAIRS